MPRPTHRWPEWWPRAATLLAHAQPAALASVTVLDLARAAGETPALRHAYGVTVAVLVAALAAEQYHEHRLCPRCAAATPEDGARRLRQPAPPARPAVVPTLPGLGLGRKRHRPRADPTASSQGDPVSRAAGGAP